MAKKEFSVLDLLDLELEGHNSLHLHCLSGRRGLVRTIHVPDLNRPGLALSGFFDAFAYERVQVFGMGEVAYLKKLEAENNDTSLRTFFSKEIPCCVFT